MLDKAYNPKDHEGKIYKLWEESGNFAPKIDPAKKPFVIAMPPPNVTGKLHIGHALFITLQDILIRYHRMKGEPTLWIPGTDHAGIATQSVVDKALQKKGTSRRELGREKFVEEVWKWKEEYGNEITRQLRSVGASCDWSRERFTLDEGLSKAVNEAFVDFYKKDLIYRGLRTVNWCPKCHTAIADDEVEYKPEIGKFYWIKYGPFVLATARPETKLGDTAVAVHPSDKRYKDMVGKKYMIPGVLGEFEVEVVADNAVDPKFGTGAIKVTPAHSLIDFEIAQRHDLPIKQVIDENGRMMENAGKYAGMKTKEAREAIVEDMQKMGLIDHIEENYEHNIATCYRCNGQIEPIPSKQWFVKMKPLAEKAKEAVKSGEIKINPKRFEKVYYQWMDNIRDWCISRQLWWGHRIPVWYRKNAGDANSEVRSANLKKMGIAERVVPQILNGKTKTYRIRDHELKIGDKVYFENSATGKIFGYGVINESKMMKVKDLPLQDKAHGAVYNNLDELIEAFKFHNPEKEVTPETDAYIYAYDFVPKEKFEKLDIENLNLIRNSQFALRNSDQNEEIYVGIEPPAGDGWIQDEDVLDTWFSSGLWPFSTLGWPEKNLKSQNSNLKINEQIKNESINEKLKMENGKLSDFDYFYPTTIMETGYDILFFWVARMVMMGLELTGKAPFETVYLHGLVRDEQNRKMSKSLGNVLNPLDVSEKFGTDAMRMALVVGTTAGNDIAVGESKIQGYRNFGNKIWNISRFITMNLENQKPETRNQKKTANQKATNSDLSNSDIFSSFGFRISDFSDEDRKDLEEFEKLKKTVATALDKLEFSRAGEHLYAYTWHEFADKIIERSKDRLQNDGADKDAALVKLLKINIELLKMLHPFMPFVTEAIWQQLPKEIRDCDMLMVGNWPK